MTDTLTLDPRSLTTPTGSVPLGRLAASLRGTLVLPGDEPYDAARRAWNVAADQRPALVARPQDAGDVMAVVQFARRHGLRIAPQATGHNAGPLPDLAGTVLLSTRGLRGVHIDHGRRRARVAAGTLWQEVAAAAEPHGLFPLAGSAPDTGVVGYTLGGGLSWLGRRHGLAANHVTAAELVTPDGRLVRATADDHAGLFWALRGGGGNFGVVTALEFGLFPYESVYAGMFLWPYERFADVVPAWRDWAASAPDEATTSLRIATFPPLPDVPPFLAGRSVVVVDGAYAGEARAGAEAVAALRALRPEMDTWAPTGPSALSLVHMDPPTPTPVMSESALLGPLDDVALATFADTVAPARGLAVGELRHTGGALGQSPPGAGARGSLPGDFLLYAAAVPMPGTADIHERTLSTLRGRMTPYEVAGAYPNFVERAADASRLFPPDTLARLRGLRASVDPDGLMVANHSLADRDHSEQGEVAS